jgi:hypothetical protein
MAATTLNITIEQYATYSQQLEWRESAEGDPRDLTGYTAKMHLRRTPTGPVLLELSDVNERIVLGGALGTIDLYIADEDTAALPAATLVYDLVLTTPEGETLRFVKGNATVVAGVTHE